MSNAHLTKGKDFGIFVVPKYLSTPQLQYMK